MRTRRILVAVLVLATSASALAGQVRWREQLREMGYAFLHLSNINAINGLNLTREQAQKLQALARQVEAAASKPPTLRATLSPELEKVRATWLEARSLILAGKPVPPELEARVNQSRADECKVIRTTIRPRPLAMDTQCASCHTVPQSGPVEPMALAGGLKTLADKAHAEGLYGQRGLMKLVTVAKQVDAILTDEQKAVLGKFTCCLVPPQDLSDPMRAGQAEGSEKAVELMRKVRRCPENWWPTMRATILKKVEQITVTASPGATAARKAQTSEEIAKLLDRVRTLSDVEFEVDKDDLSKAVKATFFRPQSESPLKTAYFLLIPGASRVYANYLKRLAQRTGARGAGG